MFIHCRNPLCIWLHLTPVQSLLHALLKLCLLLLRLTYCTALIALHLLHIVFSSRLRTEWYPLCCTWLSQTVSKTGKWQGKEIRFDPMRCNPIHWPTQLSPAPTLFILWYRWSSFTFFSYTVFPTSYSSCRTSSTVSYFFPHRSILAYLILLFFLSGTVLSPWVSLLTNRITIEIWSKIHTTSTWSPRCAWRWEKMRK